MSKSKRLRVVVVGCGGVSGGWFGAVARRKRKAEVVGLVDLRRAAAEARAEQQGLANAVVGTDMKKVLRATDPDVVFDCTVPEAHCSVVTTALRHGCHVLGEKPMAASMAEARKMVAASRKARRLYTVIQNYRYQAPIRSLARFLRSGAIGRLRSAHSEFFLGPHFGGFREEMQHVLLLDMAIHTFDAARFITGEDAKDVYCRDWNPPGSWFKHGASAAAIFNMSKGCVYTYRGSWCAEGRNTSWNSSWRIVGDKGAVTWDGGEEITCDVLTGKPGWVRPIKARPVAVKAPQAVTGGHDSIINGFLDAVVRGGIPETECRDNIKSLAMVHGAVKSAETGRRVNV